MMSIVPPPATSSRSSSTIDSIRGRRRSTTRGVNALLTRPRIRVWSGGSVNSIGRALTRLEHRPPHRALRGGGRSSAYLDFDPSLLQRSWSRRIAEDVLVAGEHGRAVRGASRSAPPPASACRSGTGWRGFPARTDRSPAQRAMRRAYGRMNLIGGRWVPARSGRTMDDRNPADGDDVLGEVARSDADDVAAAVDAAKAAYPAWMATPMPARGDLLRRVGQLLEAEKDALSRLMTQGDGQDAQGSARRRAGGHRLRLLHGRSGPGTDGRHRPERAAPQVVDDAAPPDRHRRADHAVELPRRHTRRGRCGRPCSPATASCSSRPRTPRCARSACSSY